VTPPSPAGGSSRARVAHHEDPDAGGVTTLALSVVVVPLAAGAQPAVKPSRIALLDAGAATGRTHLWEAFRRGLRELGYVEGQNITVEARWAAEGQAEHLPGLAAELVRLKPDVIVTAGAPAGLAAKQSTTIPIVLISVGDPVHLGLVASLARPGGNITG